jgi:metal transporter CNNM
VTVSDRRKNLAEVLGSLKAEPGDDVIDQDLILLWDKEKRVITGSDLFGYLMIILMRGIARRTA